MDLRARISNPHTTGIKLLNIPGTVYLLVYVNYLPSKINKLDAYEP